MVTLAHAGRPVAPHDVWSSWNLDPLLVLLLIGALWLHRGGRARGPRPQDVWRHRAFVGAIVVLAVALLSPLEVTSGALASAHMVQHVLLVLVAAPLLALSAPASTLLRGMPLRVRRTSGRVRRGLGDGRSAWLRLPTHPVTVLVLHIGVLWFWHSAAAYDAALGNEAIHAIEHTSFLVTGLLFWRVVIGPRTAARVPGGLGVLLVFGAAMASVMLSLLLTFAPTPWYEGYSGTTAAWGLDQLADQQLAGVLMWVPAGAIHVGIALALFATWLRDSPSQPHASM